MILEFLKIKHVVQNYILTQSMFTVLNWTIYISIFKKEHQSYNKDCNLQT